MLIGRARDNARISQRGGEKLFFLTSSFIGRAQSSAGQLYAFLAAGSADMNEADWVRILHRLRNGHDDSLCTLTPQIINHDVDTLSEVGKQRLLVLLRSKRMGGPTG